MSWHCAFESASFPLFEAVRYGTSSVYDYEVDHEDFGGLLSFRIEASCHRRYRIPFIERVLEQCVAIRELSSPPVWFQCVREHAAFWIEQARRKPVRAGDHAGSEELLSYRRPASSLLEMERELRSLVIDDVAALARELFKPEQLCVYFAGETRPLDGSRIKKSVDRAFGR